MKSKALSNFQSHSHVSLKFKEDDEFEKSPAWGCRVNKSSEQGLRKSHKDWESAENCSRSISQT